MLQTIEVEIDANGHILPLEPIPMNRNRRAYLTLLPETQVPPNDSAVPPRTAAHALELLASPRFANRPVVDPVEVQQRIASLRSDWGEY